MQAPIHGSQSTRSLEERKHIRERIERKRRSKIPLGLVWTEFMHSHAKNHVVAMIGEFTGTFLFLFFAFAGTEVTNLRATEESATNPDVLLYISLAFGFSLVVNAWVFYRISGGLFNPAVTLALALLKEISILRAVLLCIVQCSAGCFAAYIVSVLLPTPFGVATKLSDNTTRTQGLFIETICTAELVFTIIMLAKEKHRATFLAPLGIGLALFIAEMASVGFTGGSLNPARSLGPAAVLRSFTKDDWIYWIGPGLGSVLAVGVFKLFKGMEYELVNPGQDGDLENDPTQNLNHKLRQVIEEREAEVEELRILESESGTARPGIFSLYSSSNGRSSTGTAVEGKVSREAEMTVDLEAGKIEGGK